MADRRLDPLSERIEAALVSLYGDAYLNGTNYYTDTEGEIVTEAKAQILTLFREYAEAVIGADEPNFYGGLNYTNDKAARNSLRREQRTRLESPEADHA